jgi:hypothetical protein
VKALSFAVILLVSGVLCAGATQDQMGTMDGAHGVPSVNPDVRFVWQAHDVSGFILINPNLADSLGRHPVVRLPAGATLQIPVPQSDSAFYKEQEKSST